MRSQAMNGRLRRLAAQSDASALLQLEGDDRELRRKQRLIRAVRFPRPKRLENFRFEKDPHVSPENIGEPKNPAWSRRAVLPS
ncbi:hypothetical protein [Streptomyces puniciscabiei]|uniref:hypothetical protein n=1 Tax=Streptomyces puniciscabiei TaxID=164348 RepID=UPI0006EBB5C7|nr:hypothetical protein [Streptomyces puniciscabiei]